MIGGRYELKQEIGRGGMGVVWEAEDTVLRRPVAVKRLRVPADSESGDERALKERFLREARSAAALDHPAVISVYDVSEDADGPWMVMQLIRGRSLHTMVQEDGPLPVAEAARIGLVLLDALDCAHGEGIVHRDVKPGNVLISERGQVVLTDFGIAAVRDATVVTRTGVVIGTPGFIAPERAMGRQAGPPSDLWALGATLCVAVEGRLVHEKPLEQAGALEPVIRGLLTDDPLERWTSARARHHLRAAAEPLELPTPTRLDTGTVRLQPESEPPQGRRRGRIALATVLAVVVAGAVVAGLVVALTAMDGRGGEAAVPDLCKRLEAHPRMNEWIPNTRAVPAENRVTSHLDCSFLGTEKKDGKDNYRLEVTVVGHADSNAARDAKYEQLKYYGSPRKENKQISGTAEGIGDDYTFTWIFRIGPYVAKVRCEDNDSNRTNQELTADEIAVWVAEQLRATGRTT